MGYVTDFYIGFAAQNCIFPDTTFFDGNSICDWQYRCTYETDPAQIPSNQSNFLLYIDETCWSAGSLALFMGFANADGSDIRVTRSDGQTEIPFYVADIDTTAETISLYVLLSGISSFDPTTIQIYSGNAAASAYGTGTPYGRDACFAHQKIVIGLTEDPSGVPPQAIDWTGNLGSGTSQGGMVSGDLVDFQLGKGWEFDRVSSQYVTGSDSSLPSGRTRRRISGWIEVALDGQFEGLFLYGKNSNGQAISVYKDTSNDWVVDIIGATLSIAAGAGTHKIDVVVPNVTTPRRDDIKFYLNGVEQVMATGGSNRVVNTILSEWVIASNIDKTLFNGKKVGPAYVEALERSDDYITAEYNNQSAPGTFGEITQCLTNVGILACTFPDAQFADGNDICDWSHRFEYNTDPAQITADQTGFVIFITDACFSAAALSEIMANIQSGGEDIRVTLSDGETEIPFYVHRIDTGSNELVMSARVSGTLSSAVSTRIYIYTGNAAASAYAVTATYGRNNCFQDFEAFWDFASDPSGSPPQLTDLTGKGYDIAADNMDAPDLVDGPNGMKAWRFNGVDERGRYTNLLGSTPMTWTMWVKPAVATGSTAVFWSERKTSNNTPIAGQLYRDGSDVYSFIVRDAAGNTGLAQSVATSGSDWHQVVGTRNGNNVALFLDATKYTGSGTIGAVGADNARISAFTGISNVYYENDLSTAYARLSVASDDLITTEYNNQSDPATFGTINSWQTS